MDVCLVWLAAKKQILKFQPEKLVLVLAVARRGSVRR